MKTKIGQAFAAATRVAAAAAVMAPLGCKGNPAAGGDAGLAAPLVASPLLPASSAPPPFEAGAPAPDPHHYADKVKAWNDALTRKDMTALGAMYAPKEIAFYGTYGLTRAQVVKAKTDYLAQHPDFTQKVADVVVKGSRVTFAKTSTVGGKATTYAAYLAFAKDLLVLEGDETTDKNRAAAKDEADACDIAASGVVSKAIHDQMERCAKLVDAAHDDTVHCAGMDEPPPPGSSTWTFRTFIDHPEHIETLAFVHVDLEKRTALLEKAGKETPIPFDPKDMDAAIKACAEHPPR